MGSPVFFLERLIMGQYSELQAVNHMLVNAGASPVTSLDPTTEGGIDTGIALQILDDTRLDFQLRGLVNNFSYHEFTPDSDGKIFLPTGVGDPDDAGVIQADLLSTHYSANFPNTSSRIRIVARVAYTSSESP